MEKGDTSNKPATGAIGVAILLIVVFPMVALAFSIVTLLSLPHETLQQIAVWTKNVKRACALGS